MLIDVAGSCAVDESKLADNSRHRQWSEGRSASSHELRAGLVRNAPRLIRMGAFWIVSRKTSCDDGARP